MANDVLDLIDIYITVHHGVYGQGVRRLIKRLHGHVSGMWVKGHAIKDERLGLFIVVVFLSLDDQNGNTVIIDVIDNAVIGCDMA